MAISHSKRISFLFFSVSQYVTGLPVLSLSSFTLLCSPSPLYWLLVQQDQAVSQSNYRSIKGFVAQPSFCQRFGRSRLRGLYRVRVNEISFHVEISRKALKERIGGKCSPLSRSLSLSLSLTLSQWARVPPPSPAHTTPSILKKGPLG